MLNLDEMESARLATTLCGIPLRNPVLAASGTYGYGIEFAGQVDLNSLGGIVVIAHGRAIRKDDRREQACAVELKSGFLASFVF